MAFGGVMKAKWGEFGGSSLSWRKNERERYLRRSTRRRIGVSPSRERVT
jgi:hypothetical protein